MIPRRPVLLLDSGVTPYLGKNQEFFVFSLIITLFLTK